MLRKRYSSLDVYGGQFELRDFVAFHAQTGHDSAKTSDVH